MAAATITADEALVRQYGFTYMKRMVPLSDINPDAAKFNFRIDTVDQDLAMQYALAMEGGATFPPIIVHSESGVTGFVIDSGVHRFTGATLAGRNNIEALVLDKVNLSDPTQSFKLDQLRIEANMTHGRGLDLAERKMKACDWVTTGKMSEEQACQLFQLEPSVLRTALRNYKADRELRTLGLDPAHFRGLSLKQAILRKGISKQDMKRLERTLVAFPEAKTEDFVEACRALSEARTDDARTQAFAEFNAKVSAKPEKKRAKTNRGISGAWRLYSICGNLNKLDADQAIGEITNAVAAAELMAYLEGAAEKAALIHNTLRTTFNITNAQDIKVNRQ